MTHYENMIYILFFILQCVYSSPVIYDVTENNPVCGYSFLKLPVYSETPIDQNQHAVVFTRLPSHGQLYLCEDVGTCELFDLLITESSMMIDSLSSLTLVYVPDEDYFNHRHLVEYSDTVNTYTVTKNGSLTCTQLECFDFFQYFIPDWSIGQTRRIRVTGQSSVPSLSAPLSITGSLSNFANVVNLTDPDEDFYETEFLFVSDSMKFEASSDPKITCQDTWCKIRAVPSQLPVKLASIKYDFFQSLVLYNRLFLSVLNKYQLDKDLIDGEVCFDLPSRLSKTFVYTTIRHDAIPTPVAFYVSTDKNVFQNNDVLPTRGRLSYDGKISYTPFNPYEFSVRSINDRCLTEYYDQFNLESFVYMDGACVGIPNKTIDVCIHDKEKSPRAISIYVDDIYLDVPKLFKVNAFDANDFTWGEDDPEHSWYSFYDENKSVNIQSGVVFTTTQFGTGEIRDAETCAQLLTPGRLYNTTVFCYISLQPNAYETTAYFVSDNVGELSNTGVIVFENPHNFHVCSADDTSGIDAPCTATGKESNPYMGNTYIKIIVEVEDTSPVALNFRIEVRSLPSNGILFHCSDVNCNTPGARVKVGDSLRGKGIGKYPYFLYKGKDHYYNYNIYDIGIFGGIAELNYMDCAETCRGNDACLQQCEKQRTWDRTNFTDEHMISFTDRKDVFIGKCYYASDFGCPDNFLFDIETIEGVYPNNRYNIYVSNVGSGFSLRKTAPAGDIVYIPGDPAPFQLELTDLDGDNWDIVLEIYMGKALMGSHDAIDNIFVDADACFDNGECGGYMKIYGLPSDIQNLLKRSYFTYFPATGEEQNNQFTITGYKLYWGFRRKDFGIPVFLNYSYIENLPLSYPLGGKSVYRTNSIVMKYRVNNDFKGVVLYPPLTDWEKFTQVATIIIQVLAIVATSAMPSGPFSAMSRMFSAGRIIASMLETIRMIGSAFRAIGGVIRSGFSIVVRTAVKFGSMVFRGARQIILGTIGILRTVFSMVIKGIRNVVRRIRNFPKRKPPQPANVKPPVTLTDDAGKVIVVRDAPIITNPTRSFPATVGRTVDNAIPPPKPPGSLAKPVPSVADDATRTFVGPVSRGGRLGRVLRSVRDKIVGMMRRLRLALRKKMKKPKKKKKVERKAKKPKKKQVKKMKKKLKGKKGKIKKNKFKYLLKFMRRFLFKLVKKGARLLSHALWEAVALFVSAVMSILWGTVYLLSYILFTDDEEDEEEEDEEEGYFVHQKEEWKDYATSH